MSAPVLDPAAMIRLQRLGGDKLVRQMIRLYLENSQERLAQIAAGLAPEGDLDELRRGAHSLKSSAANVGALRVSALAAELEQAADAGDRAACEGLRSSLVQEQAEAEARLSRVVEELA